MHFTILCVGHFFFRRQPSQHFDASVLRVHVCVCECSSSNRRPHRQMNIWQHTGTLTKKSKRAKLDRSETANGDECNQLAYSTHYSGHTVSSAIGEAVRGNARHTLLCTVFFSKPFRFTALSGENDKFSIVSCDITIGLLLSIAFFVRLEFGVNVRCPFQCGVYHLYDFKWMILFSPGSCYLALE